MSPFPESEVVKRRGGRKIPLAGHQYQHGGYRFLIAGHWPVCRRCVLADDCPDYKISPRNICGFFSKRQEALFLSIASLEWIREEHLRLVERYSRNETFLDIVDLFVTRLGAIWAKSRNRYALQNQIVMQSVLTRRDRVEQSADRQAEALGLTPAARVKMRLDRLPPQNKDVGKFLEAFRAKTTAERSAENEADMGKDSDNDHHDHTQESC